jgi:predicted outer membrane protein
MTSGGGGNPAAPSTGAKPSMGSATTTSVTVTPDSVLNDMHHANQLEIRMGKLGMQKGSSKAVKQFAHERQAGRVDGQVGEDHASARDGEQR